MIPLQALMLPFLLPLALATTQLVLSADKEAEYVVDRGDAAPLLMPRDETLIYRAYIEPGARFTFYGFGWLPLLPGRAMNFLFAGLSLLGVSIAVGFAYRVCMALFCLGYAYVFFQSQMHPFVSPIFFRMPRVYPLWSDPYFY